MSHLNRCWIAVVALFVAASVAAEDRRVDPTKLSVMTFNALFIFDGIEPEEGSVHDIP